MRFIVAKKDGIQCNGCPSYIQRGEDMIVQVVRGTNNYKRVLTYHVPCYINWYGEMIRQKWADWKSGSGNIIRPKLGRPLIHTAPNLKQKLNNLRSGLSYHKSKGHTIKVKIVEAKIAKLLMPPITTVNTLVTLPEDSVITNTLDTSTVTDTTIITPPGG